MRQRWQIHRCTVLLGLGHCVLCCTMCLVARWSFKVLDLAPDSQACTPPLLPFSCQIIAWPFHFFFFFLSFPAAACLAAASSSGLSGAGLTNGINPRHFSGIYLPPAISTVQPNQQCSRNYGGETPFFLRAPCINMSRKVSKRKEVSSQIQELSPQQRRYGRQ